MVAEEYLLPTATRGAWALMSPAQADPGSPLLKPEKKEDIRGEEWVPTWRTSSPFVKDHGESVVIPEYPQKNREMVTSCSSGSKTRRCRKRGSPKPSKGDAETPMEMTPSPVRRKFSAPSDSEGYHTCYPSDDASAEPVFLAGRSHTAPNPELAHDAERESLPRRAASTIVARHTGDGEEVRMDGDGTGDTVMAGGKERGAPGKLPRDREGNDRHPHEDIKKAACGQAGSGHHCHCHHVDFLIGSWMPLFGIIKDALIRKMDKLDDTTSRILQDQAIFDNDPKTIGLHREEYEAKLESMLVYLLNI